jgi:hypothetical protein
MNFVSRMLIALVVTLVVVLMVISLRHGHVVDGTVTDVTGLHAVHPTGRIYLPIAGTGPLPPDLQRGVDFLVSQYNPAVGLLRESVPEAGTTPTLTVCITGTSASSGLPYDHKHYLANDNVLAAYALETVGAELSLASTLRASLRSYGYDHNDFIEVAWGQTIPWPPYHHEDRIVRQVGPDYIIQETHAVTGTTSGPDPYLCYFYDWSAYANLAFMAALNEHNQEYRESALRLYAIEMSKFDGIGWRDKAYWDRGGIYETIGPAWALYVGATIGAPLDDRLAAIVRRMQHPTYGGFYTHYRAPDVPEAYPNVETTSLALLGLDAYRRRVAVDRAVRYLQDQYNPAVGLIRESPVVAPHSYWLATDNRLVIYALQAAGVVTPTAAISATLRYYGDPRHGLIEALQGQVVAWPPYTETQRLIATIGPEQVWLETRLDGNAYPDWEDYADLTLFGALRAFHARDVITARQRYRSAIERMWNGVGFADAAYRNEGRYATYKLALALYVARVIGEPRHPTILNALLARQAPPGATCDGRSCAGGFYTLYNDGGTVVGDTNTETTAYATLGLLR